MILTLKSIIFFFFFENNRFDSLSENVMVKKNQWLKKKAICMQLYILTFANAKM